jgi:hypothetical protein
MAVCKQQSPPLLALDSGRSVACHLHDKGVIPIKEAAMPA